MRIILVIFIILVSITSLYAQNDTLRTIYSVEIRTNSKWLKSKYIQESLVPIGLAVGSLTIMGIPNLKVNLQKKLNWNNQSNSNYIDLGEDYVRYVPTVAAYALSAFGLKAQHKIVDRSIILTVAYIASDFVVNNTKKIVQESRPDHRENTSMPSQHTAMAFVAATFLDHELGYISPWISIGGYTVASYVGYCRVARNAHWTNDVLMGAAVGIIMTNATYWAYDGVIKKVHKNFSILPMLDSRQTGLFVCYKF